MTSYLLSPQNPVTVGMTGHVTDHNDIATDIATIWNNLQQSFYNVCSPTYGGGADPTGTADSSTAILAAINAAQAAGGGLVCIPQGTFKVATGVLTLNNGTAGYQGVRIIGAGAQSTVLKKSGAGVLLSMSGPATDTTGATHTKFCSLENLTLNGNAQTGLLLQLYYADDLFFRDLYLTNNPDVALATAELWDSRFYNVHTVSCGSSTANANTPNWLLQNSAAASGFGFSTDNVNQIHIAGCRWEGFTTGAVWIQQGTANSSNQNGLYFDDCKMETSSINGGPHFLVDNHAKFVHVNRLYCYSGGFSGGYSTAQDVIQMSGQNSSLTCVDIASGASATVANGITINSTNASQNAVLRSVKGLYGTAPTGAHVNFGTATGGFITDDVTTNTGTRFAGNIPNGADSTNVQTFTASGTWTKPPGAVLVTVICIGAGGGGGSGAVEASGTVASGGAGGGGGAYTLANFPASLLNATETVTVGTGGSGGTAQAGTSANGNPGNPGGLSSFKGNSYAVANGGGAGGAGTTGAATGGSGGGGTYGAGAGASSSATGGAGSAGSSVSQGAPGGGSGGGLATTPANVAGGAGGTSSSTGGNAAGSAGASGGGAGGAGNSTGANVPLAGSAGGGGGSSTTANGGAGGAGGNYGAGGGGGAGALNGHSSGAGGAGAGGIVVVITTTAT